MAHICFMKSQFTIQKRKTKLLFIFFISLAPLASISQNSYFMFSMGGGKSTLGKHAYTIPLSFSYERNKNKFTLRLNYNHQTGNKFLKSLDTDTVCVDCSGGCFGGGYEGYSFFENNYTRYNDDFASVGLLYGRTYRKKNKFMVSASAGIEHYRYKDRQLYIAANYCGTNGYYFNGSPNNVPFTYTSHSVHNRIVKSFGIAVMGEALFIVNDACAVGFSLSGNINKDRSVGGLALNLVIGKLKDDE